MYIFVILLFYVSLFLSPSLILSSDHLGKVYVFNNKGNKILFLDFLYVFLILSYVLSIYFFLYYYLPSYSFIFFILCA